MPISRSIAWKSLVTISVLAATVGAAEDQPLKIAGKAVEVSVTPVGSSIVRISVTPIEDERAQPLRPTGRSSGSTGARRFSA